MKENNDFYQPHRDMKVSVNLATYPPRKNSFLRVLNGFINNKSIDIIRVYLNNYTEIPDDFPQNDRILYHIGEIDLKDSGKFYWSHTFKNEYYFSCDDDLIYSEDYFKNTIRKIREYNGEVFVTTHGKILVKHPRVFNDVSRNIRCLETNPSDQWVNMLGTGASCFDNSKFIVKDSLFETHGLTDLWLSMRLQKEKIPILCRKHSNTELNYIDQCADTLFEKRFELDKYHQQVLTLVDEWVVYKK